MSRVKHAMRAVFGPPQPPANAPSILDVLSAQVVIEPEAGACAPRVSVSVSLSPDGGLLLELPASGTLDGLRRVELAEGYEVETISRVLRAQLAALRPISGEDSAPTGHQARHWQKHQIFPDHRCPFCRAEAGHGPGRARSRRVESRVGDGSVVVRTIPAKGTGGKPQQARISAAELLDE